MESMADGHGLSCGETEPVGDGNGLNYRHMEILGYFSHQKTGIE